MPLPAQNWKRNGLENLIVFRDLVDGVIYHIVITDSYDLTYKNLFSYIERSYIV